MHAQADTSVKPFILSLTGGGSYVWNKTSLSVMPGDDYCGYFKNGTGVGWHIGLDFSYMFIKDLLFAGAKLSYEMRPVSLQSPCINKFEVYNPQTGEYVSLDRLYYFDGTLNYLSLDVGAYVKPLPKLPIYFRLGFEAGLPLGGTSYTQEFQIQNPDGIIIPGLNSNRQKVGTGEIKNLSLSMAVTGTVRGEFDIFSKFMKNFYLAAEVGYRYGINSIKKDDFWKVNILRAGVGLTYKFGKAEKKLPEIKPVEKQPDIVPEKQPDTSKKVVLIEEPKDFIRTFEAMPLNINQTLVTQTYPLLPYIFFDSLSSELQEKYRHQGLPVENFEEVSLPKSTLDIYYHMLDIIGHRLRNSPESTITLTGTTDGSELPTAEERLSLANSRAESVAVYLENKWNIPKDRLLIKSKEIPDLMTSTLYKEGYEENRRVEITSDIPMILAPVVHSKFLEYKSQKNQFSFITVLNDNYKAGRWELTVTDGIKFKSLGGNGIPPADIIIDFDDSYLSELGAKINKTDSINAVFKIKTEEGKEFTKECYLKISKSDNNFEVGRLNLIVFDFDKSGISVVNKEMIKDFISTSIQNTSQTWVKGSTDRLGTVEYNNKLSLDRANSVSSYIKALQSDVKVQEIKGLGSSVLPYDNNLPEGRFYCRTVLVEVRTPIK